MERDDTYNFWNSWKMIYNNNVSHFAPVVDDCSSKDAIATAFSHSFKANSEPNNRENVENLNTRFTDEYKSFESTHDSNCNCSQYIVTLESLIDVVH